jgi:DnaK suppressor protein
VPHQNANLDEAFIERQRGRLVALRADLSGREQRSESAERAFSADHGEEATEFEDDAQQSAQIEIETGVHAEGDRHLLAIDRALKKIADGTYGLSDESGDRIPRTRLEATPEASLTLEEEQLAETRAGR